MELKVPPPIVALICGFFVWRLALIDMWATFTVPYQSAIALLIALSGFGIDVFSVLSFFKSKTTVTPLSPEKASELVTDGFFKFSRNPMYLGMALILVGWAIYCGSAIGFFGVVLFILYITRFQIIPEERVLKNVFGDEYIEYCKKVRRWI